MPDAVHHPHCQPWASRHTAVPPVSPLPHPRGSRPAPRPTWTPAGAPSPCPRSSGGGPSPTRSMPGPPQAQQNGVGASFAPGARGHSQRHAAYAAACVRVRMRVCAREDQSLPPPRNRIHTLAGTKGPDFFWFSFWGKNHQKVISRNFCLVILGHYCPKNLGGLTPT